MKYVILNIDTECGGECWLQNVSSEEAIKENVGGYSIAEKTDIGVKFYNDDENLLLLQLYNGNIDYVANLLLEQ